MDTALMTQFRRCQDTIESLKQQQQHSEMTWGEGEGGEWGWGLDGSEFDEEEEAWEDWEIAGESLSSVPLCSYCLELSAF